MSKRNRSFLIPIVVAFVVTSTIAGGGIAELTLDRAAVAGLIDAALPGPLTVELPGVGTLSVLIGRSSRVVFRDAGVETRLSLRVSPPGLEAWIDVRLVPDVDPLDGTIRLVAESAVPDPPLPVELDLARRIPPVELPRRIDWDVELTEGRQFKMTCFLQHVEVLEDRLRVELGLVSRAPGS